MHQPRFYRNTFNTERFASFTFQYRDTDLWVGIDRESFREEMAAVLSSEIIRLWQILEDYIALQPEFLTSHHPVTLREGTHEEIRLMAEAARVAGVGPMASVAGLFSWYAGECIRKKFQVNEIVVENGGDFYLLLKKDLSMTIYAGKSPLSERIAVVIPAMDKPCGVCTSSGTVGHSFSYGKADAVMVSCQSPMIADALATAMANRIVSPDDIATVLSYSEEFPEIEAIVIICEDKVGIRGNFDTKFLKK